MLETTVDTSQVLRRVRAILFMEALLGLLSAMCGIGMSAYAAVASYQQAPYINDDGTGTSGLSCPPATDGPYAGTCVPEGTAGLAAVGLGVLQGILLLPVVGGLVLSLLGAAICDGDIIGEGVFLILFPMRFMFAKYPRLLANTRLVYLAMAVGGLMFVFTATEMQWGYFGNGPQPSDCAAAAAAPNSVCAWVPASYSRAQPLAIGFTVVALVGAAHPWLALRVLANARVKITHKLSGFVEVV